MLMYGPNKSTTNFCERHMNSVECVVGGSGSSDDKKGSLPLRIRSTVIMSHATAVSRGEGRAYVGELAAVGHARAQI